MNYHLVIDLSKPPPTHNVDITGMLRQLLNQAPDLRACYLAGLPLEFSSKQTPSGLDILAKTKYPATVIRNAAGEVVRVAWRGECLDHP